MNSSPPSPCQEHWGEIPYPESHRKQKQYVEEIKNGQRPETIVLCSHPPVVTLGKKSTPGDLTSWQGEVHSVERGGKATYHGPGQVLCYPLLDLKIRGQKLGGLLTSLEKAVIETIRHYGLASTGNAMRGNPKLTGVWEERTGKKIASIGIACKNWITYHGVAVNLYRDPLAFQGINPCGYSSDTMASMEELLGKKISRKEFENHFLNFLLTALPTENQGG